MCPTEKDRGKHFQRFEPASRYAGFPTFSDTATSWNINKAQGETRPAITIKKHNALSQSIMFHERRILHTLTHVHFHFGGPHPFQTLSCPMHPGAAAQHILTCSSCSKPEAGGRWCLIAREEGLKGGGNNSTFKQGISIPGGC